MNITETLINLGNLKFKQEKYDEAISHYKKALEMRFSKSFTVFIILEMPI